MVSILFNGSETICHHHKRDHMFFIYCQYYGVGTTRTRARDITKSFDSLLSTDLPFERMKK